MELDETQKFLLGTLARPQCNFPPFRPLPEGCNVGSPKPPLQLWFQGAIEDLCKVILAGIRNLPGEHCQLLIPHTPLAYASPSSCKLIAALNFHHIYLLLLAVHLGKKKSPTVAIETIRWNGTRTSAPLPLSAPVCPSTHLEAILGVGPLCSSSQPCPALPCPAERQGALIS